MLYLDNAASLPTNATHYKKVADILTTATGNPSSIHCYGRSARKEVEIARNYLAKALNVDANNLFFTSGATESNNLVVNGVINTARKNSKQLPHALLSALEHPSVYQPITTQATDGNCTFQTLDVTNKGQVQLTQLKTAITPHTCLLAIMHVNNELGIINDIATLAKTAKAISPNIHIHIDAVQSLGKLNAITQLADYVDSICVSAHKVGGFKGIGALWLRNYKTLTPLIYGGNQEKNIRPGTENLPGIISFGLIARNIDETITKYESSKQICRKLRQDIKKLKKVTIHSPLEDTVHSIINFSIKGLSSQHILLHADIAKIAISSGSACSAGLQQPSHTLLSIGCSNDEASNAVRISLPPEGISTQQANYLLSFLHSIT